LIARVEMEMELAHVVTLGEQTPDGTESLQQPRERERDDQRDADERPAPDHGRGRRALWASHGDFRGRRSRRHWCAGKS
jgi:hypothetical protein